MGNRKNKGTSMLFINNDNNILLFLRDNIPTISCPNCWDAIGGHFEENESPEECIIRETKEEIEVCVEKPNLFKISELEDRTEYTFWEKTNLDIEKINLNEGQKLKWFSEDEIKNLPEEKIYKGFKPILMDFFNERPFDK